MGQIVELGQVAFPVAELEICFDAGPRDGRVRYLVLNRVHHDGDPSAPSYAAWHLQ